MDAQGAVPRRGARDLFIGMRYLGRGIAWIMRRPALWLLGLIPALISFALYITGLIVLAVNLDELAALATPYADDWSELWRQVARIVTMIAIFGVALFLSLVTFTAVTLVIGQPFYEKIAEHVEQSAGGAPPAAETSLLRQLARSLRDAVIVAFYACAIGIVLFLLGLIPVLGQTVIPLMAAAVSGYFLAAELTAIGLERRGFRRKERFERLRADRWLVAGFGISTVVLFMVPLGAVVIMPGAVAGATLLARERLTYAAPEGILPGQSTA